MMPTIRKRRGRSKSDVRYALENLFIAETLEASPELWMVSPWISDVPLIDNRGRRFAHLGIVGDRWLKISDILLYIARKFETRITVVISDHEWSKEFRLIILRSFKENKLEQSLNLVIKSHLELHEKTITTKDWQVGGSMNFTKQGIELRDEVVTIDTDSERIAASIIDLRQRFPWKS